MTHADIAARKAANELKQPARQREAAERQVRMAEYRISNPDDEFLTQGPVINPETSTIPDEKNHGWDKVFQQASTSTAENKADDPPAQDNNYGWEKAFKKVGI